VQFLERVNVAPLLPRREVGEHGGGLIQLCGNPRAWNRLVTKTKPWHVNKPRLASLRFPRWWPDGCVWDSNYRSLGGRRGRESEFRSGTSSRREDRRYHYVGQATTIGETHRNVVCKCEDIAHKPVFDRGRLSHHRALMVRTRACMLGEALEECPGLWRDPDDMPNPSLWSGDARTVACDTEGCIILQASSNRPLLYTKAVMCLEPACCVVQYLSFIATESL
jgi:hypothetical protein